MANRDNRSRWCNAFLLRPGDDNQDDGGDDDDDDEESIDHTVTMMRTETIIPQYSSRIQPQSPSHPLIS